MDKREFGLDFLNFILNYILKMFLSLLQKVSKEDKGCDFSASFETCVRIFFS